ncbi:MAG: SGNH/GDSL hydrolase family protein [Clostridia bacterium]|nr:SGNH/GDSL hydrolase family protein [Deltaproteobacteria bacterium]
MRLSLRILGRFLFSFSIVLAFTDCTADVTGDTSNGPKTDDEVAMGTDGTAKTDTDPASGDDVNPFVPTALIHYVGRFDTRGRAGPKFSWSASGFVTRFTGTGIGVMLSGQDSEIYFSAFIDGGSEVKFETKGGPAKLYAIASGLTPGEHELRLYRNTEAYARESQFRGFAVTDGELIVSESPFKHTIEFIGDSITTGYGNEGAPGCVGNPPATQNATKAWGSVAAKALLSAQTLVAWSGKGMYSNGDGGTADIMPVLYDRAVPTDPSSTLSLTDLPPDAVVINLGTNDFSAAHPVGDQADPTAKANYIAAYTNAYKNFLLRLRTLYPKAGIFGAVGTMTNSYKTPVQNAVTATHDANIYVVDLGLQNPPYGCDGHPSVATDAAMGATLASSVAGKLGWGIVR